MFNYSTYNEMKGSEHGPRKVGVIYSGFLERHATTTYFQGGYIFVCVVCKN